MIKILKFVVKENWRIRMFGIDALENKNLKLDLNSALYSICLLFYFMTSLLVFNVHDENLILKEINYDFLGMASLWAFASFIFYKKL